VDDTSYREREYISLGSRASQMRSNAASVNLMQMFCSAQLLELHYKLYWNIIGCMYAGGEVSYRVCPVPSVSRSISEILSAPMRPSSK
jgi:hypothetical protein